MKLKSDIPWQGTAEEVFFDAEHGSPVEHWEGLLSFFLNELTPNAADLAVRFTALDFYYALATSSSLTKEEEIRSVREGPWRDLRSMVRLLAPEKFPRDWRTIKWESRNSHAIHDWIRAGQLYDHARFVGALDHSTMEALRAQFNFWVVLDRDKKDVLVDGRCDSDIIVSIYHV